MYLCIVGTSRCGTTLLRRLLHEHPSLSLFNETHWLPRMYEFFGAQRVHWRNLLAVAERTTWDSGKDLFSVNVAYSRFPTRDALMAELKAELSRNSPLSIQAFSEILADVLFDSPAAWGDKTPDYGYYMALLQQLWPSCRFVHIIRDGIATARSMSRHSGCRLMVAAGYDNWCSLSYDFLYRRYVPRKTAFEDYLSSWRRRMARIRDEASRLARDHYLEVRFEELLGDQRRILTEVTSFLDLPAPETWLDFVDGLANPTKRSNRAPLSLLVTLSPDNLRVVSQTSAGLHFQQVHGEAEARAVINGGRLSLQKNDTEAAGEAAISVIASGTLADHSDSLAGALRLLVEALALRGEIAAANRWLTTARERFPRHSDLQALHERLGLARGSHPPGAATN